MPAPASLSPGCCLPHSCCRMLIACGSGASGGARAGCLVVPDPRLYCLPAKTAAISCVSVPPPLLHAHEPSLLNCRSSCFGCGRICKCRHPCAPCACRAPPPAATAAAAAAAEVAACGLVQFLQLLVQGKAVCQKGRRRRGALRGGGRPAASTAKCRARSRVSSNLRSFVPFVPGTKRFAPLRSSGTKKSRPKAALRF